MSAQAKTCTGLKSYDELKKKIGSFPKPKTEELTVENCKASMLESGLFQGYAALTSLYISGNDIPILKNGTFDGLTSLKYMYLNNNNIQILDNNLFKGLSKLCDLDLSCNKITKIPSGLFANFAMTTPGATLNLSNNQISEFEEDAIKCVTVLYGTFDLSNNCIKGCPTGLFVHQLIENFDLSGNNISSIEENAFERSNFRFLHLERNSISEIHPNAFNKLEIQSELHLSSNQIKLYPGIFKDIKGVHELYLDDNALTTLPKNTFQGLSHLDTLSLNKNKLTLEKEGLETLANVEYLHVEDNNLSEIKPGTFTCLKNLRNLNLAYNNFTNLKPNTFWQASSEADKTFFFVLSLHHSNIETITPGAFEGVDRVEDLQLYGNRLNKAHPDAFKGLSYIGLVNLQNNELENGELLLTLPPCRQVQLGGNKKLSGGVQPNDLGIKDIEMIGFTRTCHRWNKDEGKYKLDEYYIEPNVAPN
ncbi:hypothetical protein ILUMI_13836 [Ignelater luminosus]|uniref:Uncharacterized protein n=1 Tax=Ignelater luminosus TaxID=2038154 RepID=A0A8K0CVZ1_IGNLU|nr:hypothetical protein ILUMI_13836 [Ignelater luminosus]